MINIVILSTPFHLRQFSGLETELCVGENDNHIIHSELINSGDVTKSLHGKLSLYSYNTFDLQLRHTATSKRVTALFLHPLESLSAYREIVGKGRTFIDSLLTEIPTQNASINLIIFNDRDLLSQISILAIKSSGNPYKVIAVDEGTGFYIREGLNHKLKKIMYRYFAKYILGFDYIFMEQYGTHPDISTVYLRYPTLLPKKMTSITYHKIETQKNTNLHVFDLAKPSILLFSTLLSEDGFAKVDDEIAFYQILAKRLVNTGHSLVLKHHPREERDKLERVSDILRKYEGLEYRIVDRSVHGEEIDVSPFQRIIHFGSSVVLPILESGFPPKQIITIKLKGVAFVSEIFSKTTIIKFEDVEERTGEFFG